MCGLCCCGPGWKLVIGQYIIFSHWQLHKGIKKKCSFIKAPLFKILLIRILIPHRALVLLIPLLLLLYWPLLLIASPSAPIESYTVFFSFQFSTNLFTLSFIVFCLTFFLFFLCFWKALTSNLPWPIILAITIITHLLSILYLKKKHLCVRLVFFFFG